MKLSLAVDSGEYISESSPLSSRECYGLYPSTPIAEGASASGGLFSFPGWDLFTQKTDGNSFGTHKFKDEAYNFGDDNVLYKYDSGGAETAIGAIADDPLDGDHGAIFDDNGEVLCMVLPGSNRSYFYEPNGLGFYRIINPVFQDREAEDGGVRSVTFLDGYFVFNSYESMFNSSLVTTNNGMNFDALDIVKPFLKEKAKRVIAWNGDLVCFGQTQTKMYANVGGADFPFQEIPGATFDKGLQETRGVVVFDNTFFFYGSGQNETPSIWKYSGSGNVSKISTDYIDGQYADYSNTRFGEYSYHFNSRPFIGFYINSKLFFYDIQTSGIKGYPTWCQWSGGATASNAFLECFDKILFFKPNLINSMTDDNNLEFQRSGETTHILTPRTCIFSSAYIQGQSDSLFINRLELRMETGSGLDPNSSVSSTDPEVLLETSFDGGRTWASRGVRKVGQYQTFDKRLTWNRLNHTPTSALFRFTCTTGVPIRFHRIDIDATKGTRNA